jgi:hypothetical protein
MHVGQEEANVRTLALRVPESLHQALTAEARREFRSLNSEIIWLLRSTLARRDVTA